MTLSQQTLMELLVENLDQVHRLKDDDGNFSDIENWRFVDFDSNGEVSFIHFSFDADRFEPLIDDGDVFGGDFLENTCKNRVDAGGTLDLQWIPGSVIEFNAYSMEFCGTIETASLPGNLKKFTVHYNRFEGDFDTASLPRQLESINISRNLLGGSLNLSALPAPLTKFDAADNFFSGYLDFDALPPGLVLLNLNRNRHSGSISMLHLPASMKYIRLRGNAFDAKFVIRMTDVLEGVDIERHIGQRAVDVHGRAVEDIRIREMTF